MTVSHWWDDCAGFFGRNYILGDASQEGYLPEKKECLEERTRRESEGVIGLLQLETGARILDLPCGYGRHSLALSQRGFAVTGLDINTEHLEVARKNAAYLSFLKRDMRCIGEDLHERFDAVLNMFYSFGFFGEDENKKTMMQFYLALRKGGSLLLHTDVSPEMILAGHYRLHEKRKINDHLTLLITEQYDALTKRMNGSWRLMNEQKETNLTPYSVRIYSAEEFEQLARDVGFSVISFFGSFEGTPFTTQSHELIMIARK